MVIDKCSCTGLRSQLFDKIVRVFPALLAEWLETSTDESIFFEEHFDHIVAILGTYPARLYRAFAHAWISFDVKGWDTSRMVDIFGSNMKLAVSVAMEFCDA